MQDLICLSIMLFNEFAAIPRSIGRICRRSLELPLLLVFDLYKKFTPNEQLALLTESHKERSSANVLLLVEVLEDVIAIINQVEVNDQANAVVNMDAKSEWPKDI